MIGSLNWVDIILIAIIGLNVVGGIFKGFIKSAVSLISWIVALVAANAFYPELAVKFGSMSPAVADTAAFIIIAGVIVVIGLVASMILTRIVFLSMSLTMLNTIGGGVFGALRGAVLVVVLVYIAMLTPAPTYPAWQNSRFIPFFQGWAVDVNKMVPNSFTQQINKVKNFNPNDLKNIDLNQYKSKITNIINGK